MPSAQDEIETTYAVDADLDVGAAVATVLDDLSCDDGLSLAPHTSEHRLTARYFDTADHRLVTAGLTLRRRTGGEDGGWHLKVPTPDGARAEVRLPLARAVKTVPVALRRMVWVCSAGEPLVPVVEIVTERTAYQVMDPGGRVLLEVADDRVLARRLDRGDDDQVVSQWREVEVEVVHGDRNLLAAVDHGLRGLGVVPASSGSKVARVLGDPAPVPPPGSLDPGSPAGEVLLRHVGEQAERMLAGDPLIRLDRPDSVHKTRVATRRLRSTLQSFTPFFERAAAKALRTELRWLAGELGVVRDAEVLRARLDDRVGAQEGQGLLEDVAPGAGRELDAAYAEAHAALLVTLDSERYRRLVLALHDLLGPPPLTEQAADPAGEVLPDRVRRAYKRLRRVVRAARYQRGGPRRSHLLHKARKAAKRARYAAEVLAPVFGQDAARFARAMEEVQEELGERQDSVVLRDRLRTLARHAPSREAAFGYGRLDAAEERRGQRAERRFAAVWKTSSRKKWRRWLR